MNKLGRISFTLFRQLTQIYTVFQK